MVKMDMLTKEGDRKARMAMELANVKIEKLDPALFEIPAGMTKNDMGAMMGPGGMPNLEEMMRNAGQEQSGEQRRSRPDRGNRSGDSEAPPDMNKMLKGLFGR